MPKTALEVLSAMLEDQGATTRPKTVVEALGMLSDAVDPSEIGQHIADWVEEHQDDILSDDSVTGSKILDGTVGTDDLADGAVTDGKLSSDGVLSKANRLMGNVLSESYGPSSFVDLHSNDNVTREVPPLGVAIEPADDPVSDIGLVISSRCLVGSCTSIAAPSGLTVNDNGDGSFTIDGQLGKDETIDIEYMPSDSTAVLPSGSYVFGFRFPDTSVPTASLCATRYVDGEAAETVMQTSFYDENGGSIVFGSERSIGLSLHVETYTDMTFNDCELRLGLWPAMDEEDPYIQPLPRSSYEKAQIDLCGYGPLLAHDGGRVRDRVEIDFDGNARIIKRVGIDGSGATYEISDPAVHSIGVVELPGVPSLSSSFVNTVYAESDADCIVEVRCERSLTDVAHDMTDALEAIQHYVYPCIVATSQAVAEVVSTSGLPYVECYSPENFMDYFTLESGNTYLAWLDDSFNISIARPYIVNNEVRANAGDGSSIVGDMGGIDDEWHVTTNEPGPHLLATSAEAEQALEFLGFSSMPCYEPADYMQYSGVAGAYLVWIDASSENLYAEHPHLAASLSGGGVEVRASAGGTSFISGDVSASGSSWVVS